MRHFIECIEKEVKKLKSQNCLDFWYDFKSFSTCAFSNVVKKFLIENIKPRFQRKSSSHFSNGYSSIHHLLALTLATFVFVAEVMLSSRDSSCAFAILSLTNYVCIYECVYKSEIIFLNTDC